MEEKILGIKIQSDLKWDSHFKTMKSQLQYRVGVLGRLKTVLGRRELKSITEGLVNSKIRYCLSVFGAEYLRLSDDESTGKLMQDLQVLQNDSMRVITNHKRSEHIRAADMLHDVGCLSVNRTLAYIILIENWKAINFKVPVLKETLTECTSENRTLRSVTAHLVKPSSQEPYSIASSKLWNLASVRFRKTNLINIAKKEAKELVNRLPL